MATVTTATTFPFITLGEVVARLPEYPLSRIRIVPTPGTAQETDVLRAHRANKSLCELVDGTLVEKTMGHKGSIIALLIATAINNYLEHNDIGVAAGADSMLRLFPGLVRMPDVSFVSR